MKVYFKNGTKIRVKQDIANDIVDMKINQGKNPKTAENILVSTCLVGTNVFCYIDIDEVIAIN